MVYIIKNNEELDSTYFTKARIANRSQDYGWPGENVAHDYIQRYFVWGMQAIEEFKNNWVLKGGGALSICHLEDSARYTPDLDFTVVPEGTIDIKLLKEYMGKVCEFVELQTGRNVKFGDIEFESKPGYRKIKIPYECRIVASKGKNIEIDATTVERIFDYLSNGFIGSETIIMPWWRNFPLDRVKCYSRVELYSEKLRAIVERSMKIDKGILPEHHCKKLAKDIYDLVELHKQWRGYLSLEFDQLRKTIEGKFLRKKLKFPEDLKTIHLPLEHLSNAWGTEVIPIIPFIPAHHAKLDNTEGMPTFKQKRRIDEKKESIEYHMRTYIRNINLIFERILEVWDMKNIPTHNCFNDDLPTPIYPGFPN